MKTFRLFKRDDTGRELPADAPGYRDRHFYFKFTFRKKCYCRCLETNEAELAQKSARAKAKEIKDAALRGDIGRLDATKQRATTVATVRQLLAVYDAAAVDAEAPARVQNKHALCQLLRVAYFADPEARGPELDLPISQLTGAVTRKWFESGSKKALATTDQAQKASIKRSYNSRFVQAKSLFVPKALATYKERDVHHPAFLDFVATGETFKFSKLPATGFNPPADQTIKTTLQAWEAIDTTTEPGRNLFLAIGHELAFGLRISELAQCQWKLWTTRETYPVLDGAITVKNGTNLIQVRALDPWYSTMRARVQVRKWDTNKEAYILTGTPTDRADCIPRSVSEWLRNLGWQTQKTNHELRKYAGSQIAMKYGIYEAQCWLRHSTVKVTEQHYSGYVKRFKPENTDTIPATWAKADTLPTLRIVQGAA